MTTLPARADPLRRVAELIYLYDNEDREAEWFKACDDGHKACAAFLDKNYPRTNSWSLVTFGQMPLILKDWFIVHFNG